MPDLFNTDMTVFNTHFDTFTNWYQQVLVQMEANRIPKACHPCSWQKVCEAVNLGSASIHRYKNGKVDQKSVFCQPLQTLFINAAGYMYKQGLAMEKIQAVLHTSASE